MKNVDGDYIDEKTNYFFDERIKTEMMSKMYRKAFTTYKLYQTFILIYVVTGCVPISAFPPIVCIPIKTISSSVGLKICAITARIKKCKSRIKKKRRKTIK